MNSQHSKPYTFDRVVRMVLSIAFLFAVYFLLNRLSGALIPFFIALLLAYLINPMVDFFQFKCRFKYRSLAVLSSLLIVFGSTYFLLTWLVPQFFAEMTKMVQLIRVYLNQAKVSDILPQEVIDYINAYINNTDFTEILKAQSVTNSLKSIFGQAWKVFSGSMSFLFGVVGLLIILVYLVFLLVDFKRIADGWPGLVPPQYREPVEEIFSDLTQGMQIYFRAQGLIALIVGVLLAIGFRIIGLPMAIIIGLFIGALNIVPYLQIAGLIPVALLSLLRAMESGQSFWHVILLASIVMGVVQLIQETVLVPKIMGRVYGLHPAIILLALSVWGSLLGLLGMLIALPVTTLLFSYYKRFVLKKDKDEEIESPLVKGL
ncbi:Predicted PurR-regulated permease PerM [Saccharicrinis carchari]|uniref:Predicted PurR-regulated permease PerM n=1 Tax=Saccharicrinis carchari TaxID=1168039 RepID=A0A521AFW2_SACCC|nr:AI-2E family transporter [Saccharicrinis carchari]SMO33681.1 Predicted PurR-regulated permease PerM [Saccharicrinis carchari]